MARVKTMYSGKSKAYKNGKRYNPNTSIYKLFIYRILSKISVSKKVINRNINSKNKSLEIGVFGISEEVEREYYTYKINKEKKDKKHRMKVSFYNSDGSFSCIGILLGMCSDESYVRRKSRNLFFNNLDIIFKSEDFKELVVACFSYGVCFYLLITFFFNVPELLNYYL